MRVSPRDYWLARSGPWFLVAFAIALIAFWPSYLSLGPRGSNVYTHFHAVMASVWMLTLIVQPMLVRRGKITRHRWVGRSSLVTAPLFILAVLLLAHYRINNPGQGSNPFIQTYILWLQFSIVTLFTVSWVAALINRSNTPVHARFMVCTGLTLIDPILIRILFWIDPTPAINYQWITFGLTDLVLLALIVAGARGGHRGDGGGWVFPTMLVLFVAAQSPALFGWWQQDWWQSFAAWYASLPLS